MKKLTELLITEKWDKDVKIDNTGENTDKSIAQLKKEKEGADTKTKQQKNFAIRAKEGWPKGKIEEENSFMKNNPLLPPDNIEEISTGLVNRAAIKATQVGDQEYRSQNPDGKMFGQNTDLGTRKYNQAQNLGNYGNKYNTNSTSMSDTQNPAPVNYRPTVQEGDQGEVDHGMYAGGANPSMAFGKGTPEHAPVMEADVNAPQVTPQPPKELGWWNKEHTEYSNRPPDALDDQGNEKQGWWNKPDLDEISTGLAQKSMKMADARARSTSDAVDPIGKAKLQSQSDSFGEYVNPELKEFLATKNMKLYADHQGGVTLTAPAAVGTDHVQIYIRRKGYEFMYGNESSLDPNMLRILPNIIKRVQTDLNSGGNQIQECSTVKKKIRYRMTKDQKDMLEEIRLIKENINKLEKGKKLLY